MIRERTSSPTRESPSAQLARFMGRFDAAVATVAKHACARLRRRLPGAFELVYDNYNALVVGFSPTDKPSDAVLSVVLYPRWATLVFLEGATLADPLQLLKGSGQQVRSIRLGDATTIDGRGVRALISAAMADSDPPFRAKGRGRTIIRSVSAKQRPRRAAGAR
jgi:hypothetical protein